MKALKFIKKLNGSSLIAAVMAISIASSGLLSFIGSRKHLENSLIRLHILAASDSEIDQQLKLKVRDAVLASSDELFLPYSTSEQAKSDLSDKLDKIKEIADETLANAGSSDTVRCEITDMVIDRRSYGDMTVPAGSYTALRITIGSGEGKNWWCVMYPPLCVPCAAADMTEEEILEKYGGELTDEDILMLTESGEYKPRLYIAELIEKLTNQYSSQ